MNKNQKLAVTLLSSFLVLVLVAISMVSDAMEEKMGILDKQDTSINSSGCNPATVIYPNGGEMFNEYNSNPSLDLISVKWETCNVPSTAMVSIALEFKGDFPAYVFGDTINDGEETYVVPTSWSWPQMESGLYYKVGVTVPRENPNLFYTDFSDNLFTINGDVPLDFGEYPFSWFNQSYYPGLARDKAVAFGVGIKGYIVTGITYDAQLPKDLWEWDIVRNFWTQKADFPGDGRSNAIGFEIGNKGYVGTGQGLNTELKDFWEYDPILNKWTQKADFGGGERISAVGVGIKDKGFVGTGWETKLEGERPILQNVFYKDFWEYNPSVNQWTQKADFGGEPRMEAMGFAVNINNPHRSPKVFLGTGSNNPHHTGALKDFWEYDVAMDKWTQKADFGGGYRLRAVSMGLGTDNFGKEKQDLWSYNHLNNKWITQSDFKGGPRSNAVLFGTSFDCPVIGLGSLNGTQFFKDLWSRCEVH